ncbi:MAG TPA: DNA repair protein RecO [Candidatus Andersenbacteria bacterium]|nr:DNA repair protein RecO [Candidatus Andersenbacteria bacterium]
MLTSHTVDALIFSRRNVGEADRLVTFFTRELGLVKVLAKGVRKIPSRRGGHLEPLTRVRAVLAGKEERLYVSAIETVDSLLALRADSRKLEAAQAMARAVQGYFEYAVPYPHVFAALRRGWEMLPAASLNEAWRLEVATTLLVMREAGVAPRLDACWRCGTASPQGRATLDPQRGGWHCSTCAPEVARLAVSPQALECLRSVARSPRGVLRLVQAGEESVGVGRAIRFYAEQTAFAVH